MLPIDGPHGRDFNIYVRLSDVVPDSKKPVTSDDLLASFEAEALKAARLLRPRCLC